MNTPTKDYSLLYFVLLLTFVIFTGKAVGQNAPTLNHDAEIKANQLIKQTIEEKVFTGVSTQLMIIPSRATVAVVLANTSGAWHEALELSIKLLNLSKEVNETGE